jgi:hypothetical protein
MNHPSWLTPFNLDGFAINGAVYDHCRNLCTSSLRYSPKAVYLHCDPPVLDEVLTTRSRPMEGDFIYLGHLFDGYGHFLLETLPMLSEVLSERNRNKKFIFLPFITTPLNCNEPVPMPATEKIMRIILEHIAPDRDDEDIVIHCERDILKGTFTIAPRPVQIRHTITNPLPYLTVIAAIKQTLAESFRYPKTTSRLFLSRKEDRIVPEYGQRVESLCKHAGFSVVRPELHPFEEQVALVAQAELIAGFQGSQLHNALFAHSGATVIEFGDSRRPHQANINQNLIAGLNGTRFEFIPYTPENFSLVEHLLRILT